MNIESVKSQYITEGLSCQAIAEKFNVSATTIRNYLIQNGVKLRERKSKYVYREKIPTEDLSGRTFGNLTVSHYSRGGWVCNCSCGNTKILRPSRLLKDNVKTCGYSCKNKITGSRHKNWQGVYDGDLSMQFYTHCYSKAEERGLEFEVSLEYLWDLFLAQDKRCNLTGIELVMMSSKNDTRNTASLDRIDSSKGYIIGNVQWIHKVINQMKWNFRESEFVDWCKLVARHN